MDFTPDRKHGVQFRLTFMGEADFDWYNRETDETRRVSVRYLPESDYERSIANPHIPYEPPPPVGTLTCTRASIPASVVDLIWKGSVWADVTPLAGYHTVLA